MPPLQNSRHEKFCLEMLTGCSAIEAAARAGYTGASQSHHTNRLTDNPQVQARLKELQTAAASDRVASVLERKMRLTKVIRNEDTSPGKLIAAIAELNKMEGSYAPAKTETTSQSVAIKTIIVRQSPDNATAINGSEQNLPALPSN